METDTLEPTSIYLASSVAKVNEWLRDAKPDAIFVSSGGLRPDDKPNSARPTGFADRDTKGNLAWGKARAVAGSTLIDRFPNIPIVTLSRSTFEKPEASDAEGMAHELQRLTNRARTVIELPDSRDTFSELLETVNASLRNGWENPVFVTTVFQELRVQAMLESILNLEDANEKAKLDQMMEYNRMRYSEKPGFIKHFDDIYAFILEHPEDVKQIKIDPIPAEGVFPIRNKRYESILVGLAQNDIYQHQLNGDVKGARDWRSGNYGKK